MSTVSTKIDGKSCFNRYMVECEYRNSDCGNQIFIVLIDTWWNVNTHFSKISFALSLSFNRYMVECEYSITSIFDFTPSTF